jgi:exodeoxyribonuclease V gamma subunit
VRKRLGLSLWENEDCLSDIEPFDVDHLERYRIKEELLANELETGELLPYEVFQARGMLPAGTMGELHLRSMKLEVQSLLKVVQDHIATGAKDEPVDVDLPLETFRLGGKIHSRYGGKCVHFRTAKLKGADHLRAWIEHLALGAVAEGDQPETVLIGSDAFVTFGRVPSPRAILQTLCEHFAEGLTLPLRFFPESGLAFVQAEQLDQGDPLTKAKAKWLGPFPKKGEKRRGEKDDVFITRCFDADSLDEDFAELARVIFGPILEHSKREEL